jgi:beta-lactamase regulating signal transducer with metallopeptidase domain
MMPAFTDAALWLSRTVELSLLAKATLLLAAALTATRLARHARASVRHLVIASCFVALIVLPALLAGAPAMTIDVPVTAVATLTAPPQTPAVAQPRSPLTRAAEIPRPIWPDVTVGEALRAIWIGGTILFLIPIATVLWKLSTIRRTGIPVAWHRDALAHLAASRGVNKPVELVEHEAVPGPMTFGITRPVIVLPFDAREWSDAELRRALLHELEHIQRGDWIMQIMARVVAACYWFHPLVWMAWRRLCLEAERSCDDAVVMSEERTDYAEQLVTLAQRMSATPVQPLLGMANRSDLSARVTAVLDDRLRRGRAGFAMVGGTLAGVVVLVGAVAPVRAVEAVVTAENQSQIERNLAEIRTMAEKTAEQRRRTTPAPGDRKSRALDTELYEAANEGDYAGVRELVEAGANANAVIDGDGSPLIGAARSGKILITQYLLDHGADPNQPVPGDGSPLIAAAAHGHLDQVALLIQRGADVNLAVDGDENPLMNAAEQGHIQIVKFLIDNGADIHTRIRTESWQGRNNVTEEWRTALSQARKNRRMDVVRYLESLGARDQ